MKKFTLLLATIVFAAALFSCKPVNTSVASDTLSAAEGKPIELTVVTSYGGDDGNRANYERAYKAYEASTGNIIRDMSGISNEAWKASVLSSFEDGSEPDILFYFSGADSNKLVSDGKVVPIDEIREIYPGYASNMKDDVLAKSQMDGKNYAVPVNGYWEGLFVNKAVLNDCGVEIPGPETTWDQFLSDCEKIAASGYIPIAASLNEVPHYWFEFCILNNGSAATHNDMPVSASDANGNAWASGLYDIKELYERGFFPDNTLSATVSESDVLLISNKAAFMIEGSWKMGWLAENASDINNFTVTYVPGKGGRAPTDIIGGLSMGYFITRKAWENPEKQAACIEFVTAMTADTVVATFGATAVTALKDGLAPPEDSSGLVQDALAMANNVTALAPAVGDSLLSEARANLFANVKRIVTGEISAEEAVGDYLQMSGS